MFAKLIVLMLLAATTTSCLTFEAAEFRFERARPRDPSAASAPWHYELALRHLESDAKDSTGLARDFASLLDDFQEARDSARAGTSEFAPGAQGSTCELGIERGDLVFRQRGTIASPESVHIGELRFASGEPFTVRVGRDELGATNGRIVVSGDSAIVSWPRNATTIRFVARQRPFSPAAGSRFAERYRARRAGS